MCRTCFLAMEGRPGGPRFLMRGFLNAAPRLYRHQLCKCLHAKVWGGVNSKGRGTTKDKQSRPVRPDGTKTHVSALPLMQTLQRVQLHCSTATHQSLLCLTFVSRRNFIVWMVSSSSSTSSIVLSSGGLLSSPVTYEHTRCKHVSSRSVRAWDGMGMGWDGMGWGWATYQRCTLLRRAYVSVTARKLFEDDQALVPI